MQLENTGIRVKGYDFITSYLLAPIAILGVGWRYDEKLVKRKQTKTELILDPFGMLWLMKREPRNTNQS